MPSFVTLIVTASGVMGRTVRSELNGIKKSMKNSCGGGGKRKAQDTEGMTPQQKQRVKKGRASATAAVKKQQAETKGIKSKRAPRSQTMGSEFEE